MSFSEHDMGKVKLEIFAESFDEKPYYTVETKFVKGPGGSVILSGDGPTIDFAVDELLANYREFMHRRRNGY